MIATAAFTATFAAGCSRFLEEKPHTVFSVEYFKTPQGFEAGIITLYSSMRFLYGPEGAVALGVDGTDEWTYGEQPRTGAGGTGDFLTLGNYTLDPANGALLTPWNRSFNNINLANGLLEFGLETGIPEATLTQNFAEIRFLRGLYYLNLVSHFGAVPLDLGSGDLQFNQVAFQGFNRENTAELLVKNYQVIIDDFKYASENLPDRRPAEAFRLSKSAAFHMLAKAYIHRGYSAAADPSDFENAYTAATELINNQGQYGVALQTYYEDVHAPHNDYNSEMLFSIERVYSNFNANEVADPTGIGGTKGIDAHNDFCGDYTAVRAPTLASSTRPVSNRVVPYGRPIRRFCPTPWTFFTAFADKINDSRWDGSFRRYYIASVTGGGFTEGEDTAFVVARSEVEADYLLNDLNVPYRVIRPSEMYFISGSTDANLTANFYPSLSKYEDPDNINPNNQGTRPFPVAKLGETYLLAAEAAFQTGRVNDARDLINVLKRRAANRKDLSEPEIEARYDLIRISAGDVTLDYILDERTRELVGESMRWPDLAVRGKLVERVRLHNTDAASNIQEHHVLRPIPRGQLDNVADNNVQRFQNPGY